MAFQYSDWRHDHHAWFVDLSSEDWTQVLTLSHKKGREVVMWGSLASQLNLIVSSSFAGDQSHKTRWVLFLGNDTWGWHWPPHMHVHLYTHKHRHVHTQAGILWEGTGPGALWSVNAKVNLPALSGLELLRTQWKSRLGRTEKCRQLSFCGSPTKEESIRD